MNEFYVFSTAFSDVFLIRPEWLWLLLLNGVFFAPLILNTLKKNQHGYAQSHSTIDPEFLQHLTEHRSKRSKTATRLPLFLLLNSIILIATGPGFRSIEIDQDQQIQPLIILLDQSVSMMATDISPNRHTQSLRFINNLLTNNSDVPTAVYVYAGSTHRLTPMTNDHATIKYLLEQSDAWSMPKFGSNAQQAIRVALEDLTANNILDARILLITDELLPPDLAYLNDFKAQPLDIYWTGSALGAPIVFPEHHLNAGNYVRDQNNTMVMATTNINDIQALASSHIHVSNINLNKPIDLSNNVFESDKSSAQQTLSIKEDAGFMLIPIVLLLFLFAYRKTSLQLFTPLFAIIMVVPLLSNPVKANDWLESLSNSFLNDSQKAQKFAQENQFEKAAELNADFSAFNEFHQGNVDKAIEQFSNPQTSLDYHNLGTSQLKAEQYEAAIESLKQAVKLNSAQTLSKEYLDYAEQALAQKKESSQDNPQNDDGSESESKEQNDSSQQQNNNGEQNEESSDNSEPSESEQGQEQEGKPSKNNSDSPSDQQAQQQELQQQEDMKQQMQQSKGEADNKQEETALSKPSEASDEPLSEEEQAALAAQQAQQQAWDKEQQALDELLNQVPESNIDFMANKFHRQLQQQPQSYEGQPW